jgi:hypothetical protein
VRRASAANGGVNDSLKPDSHGEMLAFLWLSLEVAAPKELAALFDPVITGEAECLRR